ncbi:hypothetical protein YPPY01_3811, partial [Yersinia pestis PY-01]
MRHHHRQ